MIRNSKYEDFLNNINLQKLFNLILYQLYIFHNFYNYKVYL
jgi:hypothetical protein